ncbi:MAG: hypothetical protein PHC51_08960, partial [bacterium]|nr:hypothetical protein [bacterium]
TRLSFFYRTFKPASPKEGWYIAALSHYELLGFSATLNLMAVGAPREAPTMLRIQQGASRSAPAAMALRLCWKCSATLPSW